MTTTNRRNFLGSLSLLTAAISLPGFIYSSITEPDGDVITTTTYGKIKGERTNGVNIFIGIPYAGRVSGDRRFRRPAKLEAWTGVLDTLKYGAPAVQPNNRDSSENCLFLNIWTPANDNKKRPVMFYNHGGGFATGSGGNSGQDGTNLARIFDVVVVETNHRLGLMGYLYLDELGGPDYAGSGNNGMLDIVDGLAWVNKNIETFGGNPGNVMIFGESGGGAKTTTLYAMPTAAPYFNKASIESGPGLRMIPKEAASAMTAIVLKELNIDAKDWKKLLEVPIADFLKVQAKISDLMGKTDYVRDNGTVGFVPNDFGPVVDGVALPRHPFDPDAPEISKNKPLMTGWNEDEYAFFAMISKDTAPLSTDFAGLQSVLEPQFGTDTAQIIKTYRKTRPNATAGEIWMAIKSINMFGLGTIAMAERKVKQHGAPVYLYNFDYKSEVKIPGTDYPMGTPHAMDISFKFNNEQPSNRGGFLGGNKPERFIASHKMAELWITFARTGKPAAKDVPEWPAYDLTNRPTMLIDEQCKVVDNRNKEEVDMWRSINRIGYHALK